MQIAALGGDIERVLQFAHGEKTPWILTALFWVTACTGYLKNIIGWSD